MVEHQLSDADRAWLIADEARWKRAYRIVGLHPQLDVTDVYHSIWCIERSPSERLRRGLRRGKASSESL